MPTAKRNIRVDDELWAAAKCKAAGEGTNPSELIRRWLTDYLGREPECEVTITFTRAYERGEEEDLDPDMVAAWAAAQILHKHGIDGAAYEELIARLR